MDTFQVQRPPEPVDLEYVRSRIGELTGFLRNSGDISGLSPSDSEKLLQDCVLTLETKVNQIFSEPSDVGSFSDEDFDAYIDRLSTEVRTTEAEIASTSKEIEGLTKLYMRGTCQLESNLECLHHAVDYIASKNPGQAKAGKHVDNFRRGDDHLKLLKAHGENGFEISNLKNQIEKNKMTLKSLQDLDLTLKRVEAIEKIEEALTGLKVIEIEGNCIRVSLRTYIPDVEGLMCQLKAENSMKLSEVNHELLIEVMNETMALKNVDIFPNDVYIGEIIEAADAFSKLFSVLSVPETRSSLGWFLQKVQDRIVTCTTRQLMVKIANKSRHSFEYVDKDEVIIAHMIGGVDAFIKPSQGWPLCDSALKLVSLRSSDQKAKEISLSLLCKVEEMANSLDFYVRKNITSFVDGIEEIILEKMRPELHSDNILL